MFASAPRRKNRPEEARGQKPKHKRTGAGWERERERSAATQAALSRRGRDIAPTCPSVKNPARRQLGRESFERFCKLYFPETFSLPWSDAHRRAIDRIERAVRHGGKFAYAMPRGSGKTSLAEVAAIWALLYGCRQFVVVIGVSEEAALDLLESVKSELENNELLAEDFPLVCHPIRCLEGISHRCRGQLFDGQRTQMVWTAKMLVLPTIPGSEASGGVLQVTGIEGRIRGMKFKRADGRNVRPDLAIVDDPQTDQTAKSPTENDERERILNKAVLGLAGPKKKIACFMPCTVIRPNDMADRMLDRDRNPEWQGERTKMLTTLPTKLDLWDQYWKIRADNLRAGGDGSPATEFYENNQAEMDAGAIASWPVRFNADELSAIQHAMNIRLATPEAFASEYQNEPLRLAAADTGLPAATEIAAKMNAYKRGIVPATVTRLTAFVDVQQNALFWGVCGFEDDFTGYLIDYGVFPEQHREHFRYDNVKVTLKSHFKVEGLEDSLRRGLDAVAAMLLDREWEKTDESTIKIERMPVDFNWQPSSGVVHKFARESKYSGIALPARGFGIGAAGRPFNDYKPKQGERRGLHWRTVLTADRPYQRRLYTDTNFWKSFLFARLAVGIGGQGCFSLFKDRAGRHQLLAEHLLAEDPIAVTAKDQTVVEWKERPSKPDNHWLDVIVGCMVAAAERGASLIELKPLVRPKPPRVRLSELYARKHGGGINR